MKSILKLFPLIAGLSLCMVENPSGTVSKATISLRGMSGEVTELEVPVVGGECRVSDLMAQLYASHNINPEALNTVIPNYTLLCDTKILSDDEMVSVESDISFVRQANYTKVRILAHKYSEETITLFGDLEAIFKARFEGDLKTFDEYSEYIKKYIKNTKDIRLDNLFFRDEYLQTFCHNISLYIDKVITSSGQVFTKNIDRSNYPGAQQHSALFLFHAISIAIYQKRQDTITQTDIDQRGFGHTIPQAWALN